MMKRNITNRRRNRFFKTAAGITAAAAMCVAQMNVFAAESETELQVQTGQAGMIGGTGGFQGGEFRDGRGGNTGGEFGGGFWGEMSNNVALSDEPTEIATSTVVNTAAELTADEANAVTIAMSEDNNQVKISEAGTYIVTGECSDGNITVKKGTTGVVLILKDLTLTSTTGATVSLNKGSEVKLIIEGTVNLTDAENPEDEDSEDTEVADAFDGAAIKAKDGSNVYLTGTGTLNIDALSCKNGIKVGDEDTPSFVVDGSLTININAANDAFNAGYDLTILSGTINISAADDAIHADRILTIGSSDGRGPEITVNTCEEGFEGTVVNLFGGEGTVNSNDDGINAANSDGTYSDELDFSVNITGRSWTVKAGGDGIDSNGNINITGGYVSIQSASAGGEAGIDYDGECYISEYATVDNNSGMAGSDGGGMNGGNMNDGGMNGGNMNGGEMNGGEMRRDDFADRNTNENNKDNTGTIMFGWGIGDSSDYWYEDGIRQGTEDDEKCFSYDGTVRGREIYDPASNAWYWLDADADGAKATGKEVFMPYIYQNEADWSDEEITSNAAASDDGLTEYVLSCIKNQTGKWVRYDENGKMLKGWVTIKDELAVLYPDQAGNTYYYDTKTGLMAKGDVTIDGIAYHFDEITGILKD